MGGRHFFLKVYFFPYERNSRPGGVQMKIFHPQSVIFPFRAQLATGGVLCRRFLPKATLSFIHLTSHHPLFYHQLTLFLSLSLPNSISTNIFPFSSPFLHDSILINQVRGSKPGPPTSFFPGEVGGVGVFTGPKRGSGTRTGGVDPPNPPGKSDPAVTSAPLARRSVCWARFISKLQQLGQLIN